MKDAQKWLRRKYYSEETKAFVTTLNIKEGLEGHLSLVGFERLKLLVFGEFWSYDEEEWKGCSISSIDIKGSPNLNFISLRANFPLSLLDNIKGLENTSLTKLSIYDGLLSNSKDPNYIWNTLMRLYEKFFPEMALIDVRDLENDFFLQLTENSNYDNVNFLEQLCPEGPEIKNFVPTKQNTVIISTVYWICDIICNRILARMIILQNRLYEGKDEEWEKKIENLSLLKKMNIVSSICPKHDQAAYIPTRKKLCDKLHEGDPELVGRVRDLPWIKWNAIKIINIDNELRNPLVRETEIVPYEIDLNKVDSEVARLFKDIKKKLDNGTIGASLRDEKQRTINKFSQESDKPLLLCKANDCKNYIEEEENFCWKHENYYQSHLISSVNSKTETKEKSQRRILNDNKNDKENEIDDKQNNLEVKATQEQERLAQEEQEQKKKKRTRKEARGDIKNSQ